MNINKYLLEFVRSQKLLILATSNKDKPWINCKGKCHLKKQVKKAEKEEKKQNPFISSENSLLFYFSAKQTLHVPNKETINNFNLASFYSFEYIPKLLKPPQLFS